MYSVYFCKKRKFINLVFNIIINDEYIVADHH